MHTVGRKSTQMLSKISKCNYERNSSRLEMVWKMHSVVASADLEKSGWRNQAQRASFVRENVVAKALLTRRKSGEFAPTGSRSFLETLQDFSIPWPYNLNEKVLYNIPFISVLSAEEFSLRTPT